MNKAIPILLLFVFSHVYAAENMTQADFEGRWESNYAAVKGETQVLVVSYVSESVFERHFEKSFSLFSQSSDEDQSQILKSNKFEIHGDLLILTFTSNDKVFGYKLALSGWKSEREKVLYGSMFMYRNEKQFNMLPVSFSPAK